MIARSPFLKKASPHPEARGIYLTKDCTDGANQVKVSEDQRAARSGALRRRRAMGRRSRQHFPAGKFTPRMYVRRVHGQRERRGAARVDADAPAFAARRSGAD